MVRARSRHVIAALAASLASVAAAQEGYTPSPENLKARAWFQEARFGLFIHWGVYAVAGDGEWVMQTKRITVPEYERDFPPAFNPVKFDPAAWVAMAKAAGMKYPFEMCETMNDSWGYNKNDSSHKSTKDLLQLLVKAAGYDANLLLNVGPRPDGTIQPEFTERLAQMGEWLKRNGETIYGTRGGPVPPRPWGVTTQKGSRVYVHLLDWQDPVLSLPRPKQPLKAASRFGSGQPVRFSLEKDALLRHLDPKALDPVDTIVVLELDQ